MVPLRVRSQISNGAILHPKNITGETCYHPHRLPSRWYEWSLFGSTASNNESVSTSPFSSHSYELQVWRCESATNDMQSWNVECFFCVVEIESRENILCCNKCGSKREEERSRNALTAYAIPFLPQHLYSTLCLCTILGYTVAESEKERERYIEIV